MIKFVPPINSHLTRFVPLPVFDNEPWRAKILNSNLDNMWTMIQETTDPLKPQVLAFIGISPIWTGTVQVWAVVGDELKKYGFSATRKLRRFIEAGAEIRNVHRAQMTVKSNYTAGQVWAASLGFSLESTMFNYGPDKSHYEMWVRHF